MSRVVSISAGGDVDASAQGLRLGGLRLGDVLVHPVDAASLTEITTLLAQMSPESVAARENSGWTTLHRACAWQTGATGPAVVAALLAHMSPEAINARTNSGFTALHWACKEQTYATGPAVVTALLATMSPDAIEARETSAGTALHEACRCQTGATGPAVVAALLAKMSSDAVEARDGNGRTALHVACARQTGATGSAVVAALLAKMSPDAVDARDNDGWTALHWACLSQTGATGPAVVAPLLGKMSPDAVDTQDNGGCTALHYACLWQTGAMGLAIVSSLLAHLTPEAVDATLRSLSQLDPGNDRYDRVRATGVVRVLAAVREEAALGVGRPLGRNGDDPIQWRIQWWCLARLGDAACVTPESRAHGRAWWATRRAPPALRIPRDNGAFATMDAGSPPASAAGAAADDLETAWWRASCVVVWHRTWEHEVRRRLAPLRRSGLLHRWPFTAQPVRAALQARVADLDPGSVVL